MGLAATTTDAVGLGAGDAVADEEPFPPEHATSTELAKAKVRKAGRRVMLGLLTAGFRRVLSVLLVGACLILSRPAVVAAAVSCAGADPAIVSATVQSTNTGGGINRYSLAIRVANLGSAKQPSNLLQSVDIYENGIKLDTKGLPPLRPRQSYSFVYVYQRSADAGAGTTVLHLNLTVHRPSPTGQQDCNARNDAYTVTF